MRVADHEEIVLLAGLLLADTMTLTSPDLNPDLNIGQVVFDLTGLVDTPVQGNIDHCGACASAATR